LILPVPRIAVLISGEGSNLQALIDATSSGTIDAEIALVVSNRAAARGLERARRSGIPAQHLGAAASVDRAAYDAALTAAVARCSPDVVVLAGFMRILGAAFLERFGDRILNIHPSLLPKYPGLDTHQRVLAAGDAWHGATVHFVTAELDSGPRVLQYRIAVRPQDTAESLTLRVHTGEHIILPRAVAWLAQGRLRLSGEEVMLDGRRLEQPVVVEGEA
jgi:phosphoribosylglycinamide formyltransferase-1